MKTPLPTNNELAADGLVDRPSTTDWSLQRPVKCGWAARGNRLPTECEIACHHPRIHNRLRRLAAQPAGRSRTAPTAATRPRSRRHRANTGRRDRRRGTSVVASRPSRRSEPSILRAAGRKTSSATSAAAEPVAGEPATDTAAGVIIDPGGLVLTGLPGGSRRRPPHRHDDRWQDSPDLDQSRRSPQRTSCANRDRRGRARLPPSLAPGWLSRSFALPQ